MNMVGPGRPFTVLPRFLYGAFMARAPDTDGAFMRVFDTSAPVDQGPDSDGGPPDSK